MKLGNLELENCFSLAPLVGITDTLFRSIAKRYGCGLVFSEMINSNGVLKGGVSYLKKLEITPEEEPVGIQLAGDNPKIMVQAAQMAEASGAKILNINMGCPSQKITKNKAGCALMTNPALVKEILQAVKNAISIPLSIKIRLGWDDKTMNYLEIAHIAESEGCVAVFMHARTRAQGFSGQARWPEIKKLKEYIKIPVIGNGDVTSHEKALLMMRETGCDGVMIGRGALGQPWIFRPFEPTLNEKKALMLEHLNKSIEKYGEELGIRLMRKHFAWYSQGLPHSSQFRKNIHTYTDPAAVRNYIEQFFKDLCSPNMTSVVSASTANVCY